MNKKIVLIDGHSILNRAFYGIPDLTNSEGLHTNAIYGFINILLKILDEEKPDYLTVAFDVNKPTFRHDMFAEYKGTRKSMPPELREQVPMIKEVLEAMGVLILEKPGYEADDVLGTLAKNYEKEGVEVSLVSGDRDMLQLASDKIKIRIPKTNRGTTIIEDYNTAEVIEKYQVTPQQIIDLKGLMGDTADNIPGVPGIGEKTATKIIVSYSSVENAIEHIEEIKPNKAKESLDVNRDLALLSKELATIKTDCELDYSQDDAKLGNLFNNNVFVLFKRLEFKNLLSRFQEDIDHHNAMEDDFSMISNLVDVDQIFNDIEKKKSPVGFQYIIEDQDILGLSLAVSDKEIYYIPVEGFITTDYLVSKLNHMIEENILVLTMNLKEQLPLMKADDDNQIWDIGVAAYLLNPIKDSYHYDDIGRDYLDMAVPSRTELLGKEKLSSAMNSKEKEFLNYTCYSAYIPYKAYHKILEELKNTNMYTLYHDIELPLIYALYDMEVRGIEVDEKALKEYGDKLGVRIIELEKEIYEIVGETFNINSPKQLGIILFEKLKLPFAKKTKTGYSTSADILEKLRGEAPVVGLVLEYRQLTKLKSTYADGLANYINQEDNRIHGKFNQTVAATGRISSTEPNLQNIPIRMELGRQIRKVFIPKEGYIFLDADYSQIELRVLAHMSKDEILIDAYREEQDIHRITAAKVFHTPLEEVTDIQRSSAKAVNFGIVYGISSFGLGQDLNITRKEAESYINKYFETYPKIKEFLDGLVTQGKEQGYVTTMFHRRRPIPELSSSNFMQRSFGERIAMNSPIQGTAADIIKIAMIRVNRRLKNLQLRSRLLLQIHDELLIEAHLDEVEQVKEILIEEMHDAASLSIPLEVDVNQGMNWYDAK